MPITPPFLILEAGLHGEGSLNYYGSLIDQVAHWWTGWPRIVFKTQYWVDDHSSWYTQVTEAHGRPPLKSLDAHDLRLLARACRDTGFGFCITPHDHLALGYLFDEPNYLDFVKLGSAGAADPQMLDHVRTNPRPWIVSTCLLSSSVIKGLARLDHVIQLSGTSAYPANKPWDGEGDGYTAHNVPAIATELAVSAASRGAQAIEVHVSIRRPETRPMPGDLCVSLTTGQFKDLAADVGCIWSLPQS